MVEGEKAKEKAKEKAMEEGEEKVETTESLIREIKTGPHVRIERIEACIKCGVGCKIFVLLKNN